VAVIQTPHGGMGISMLFLEIPHTLGVWQEPGMYFIGTICLSWSICINQPIVLCLCLDHSG
ncbi:mCG145058, partial [Mus musculus]